MGRWALGTGKATAQSVVRAYIMRCKRPVIVPIADTTRTPPVVWLKGEHCHVWMAPFGNVIVDYVAA